MSLLEVMQAELERHGLPRRYVDRVCGELAAHLDESSSDLVAQGVPPDLAQSIATTRMGCPIALASRMYQRQAAHSFWLRHPLFAVLATSVTMFLILGAAQLALFATFWRSLSPGQLEGAHLAARISLPLVGSWILHPVFAWYVGKKRWFRLAVAALIILSSTSVVRLTPVLPDHAVATLRLIP
jgi:hypothetical protein